RKKRETRQALARAGVQLFVERGYDATTLADIAEVAGVSTRTIFAYFPSKEDILFASFETMHEALAQSLAERPAGQDPLAAVSVFILASAHQETELDCMLEDVIAGDQMLSRQKRARIAQLQGVLAAAIAEDLGAGPDDLRANVAAASLTAAFEVLEQQERVTAEPTNEEIVAAIDPIIAFVRAGLQALPAPVRR